MRGDEAHDRGYDVTRRITVRRMLAVGAAALIVSTLLTGTSSADTFSNTTPIVVPRPAPPAGCPGNCPFDQANPYPSNIVVSGITGTVTDVNVTLNDLTYGRLDPATNEEESGPGHVDIMLVAPSGATTMLMSDACGNGDFNRIATPIDLTFDDQAAETLPADAPCQTGTYHPTDDDDDGPELPPSRTADGFNPPAPATSTTAALSTFNGTAPNGTWSLYMVDDGPNDQGGNDGEIGGGWTLAVVGGGPDETTTTTTDDTTTTTTDDTTTTTTSGGGGATTTTTAGGTTTTTSTGATTTTTTATSPTLQLSRTTVAPGEAVVLTGAGLPANTPLQVNFLSDPVRIGSVTTNGSGAFQTTVTIPADATGGAHQINVTDSGGQVLAAANLTVARSTTPTATRTLARTGYGLQAMIVLATGLILLGHLVSSRSPAASTRRRRRRW